MSARTADLADAAHGSQTHKLREEAHLKVLRLIQAQPHLNQRELAEQLGISLGKTNYLIKGLIEKGWVKANNFKNSDNKLGYLYQLTPSGLENKAKITLRYLARRTQEYQDLRAELEQLQHEVSSIGSGARP